MELTLSVELLGTSWENKDMEESLTLPVHLVYMVLSDKPIIVNNIFFLITKFYLNIKNI